MTIKQETSRGSVEIDGGRLSYEVAGRGSAVVLAHAGFLDSRMWDDQWFALSRGHRAVRFDLRGFGRSDAIAAPFSRSEDLRGLLEHLGIAAAALVGCSLSGETALDLALTQPAAVSALILVSAVPRGFELRGEPPRYLMEMMAAAVRGDLDLASELQNRIWIDGPFREPHEVDAGVRARAAAMSRIPLERGTWGLEQKHGRVPPGLPAASRLAEVRVPTLVVAGGLDHPEILRAAHVMAASIPGSRKLVIPGCAHIPSMERPRELTEAVLSFLGSPP